jgi:hypothetical protein
MQRRGAQGSGGAHGANGWGQSSSASPHCKGYILAFVPCLLFLSPALPCSPLQTLPNHFGSAFLKIPLTAAGWLGSMCPDVGSRFAGRGSWCPETLNANRIPTVPRNPRPALHHLRAVNGQLLCGS